MSTAADIDSLYGQPMPSSRTGALFNAFSYPTKIDPEAIAVFLATHTTPGQTVLDPFGGSGTTAVAARLCEHPTFRMRALASQMGVSPTWGARNAVVYELSPLGSLIGQVLATPPDPDAFTRAACALITAATDEIGWMYAATGPDGEAGHIRHTIWSEVLRTPCCRAETTFWAACVRRGPVGIAETFACPQCGAEVQAKSCPRELTASGSRVRVPVWMWGSTGRAKWDRAVTAEDLAVLGAVRATDVDPCAPEDAIKWGDLYRSGYHAGMVSFRDLYSPRNLRVFARLWSMAALEDGPLGDALRLWLLSYNASHSTLMTRVVVKSGQNDFVITGAQSGVLYVSGLPVEKNIPVGLRRKITTFSDAFRMTHGGTGTVAVVNASSTALALDDDTVDYVFTDPPFGGFIPYSEVNQVNEAWLGRLTDRTNEAIVSPAQGKGTDEYALLMKQVFAEAARALKPTGAATVVFHASKPEIWAALGDAFETSGLDVYRTSMWDKTQVSFKQVVHDGSTRHDALFLLRPSRGALKGDPEVTEVTPQTVLTAAGSETSVRRLYTRYVTAVLEAGQQVMLTATEFYAATRKLMPAAGAK